MGMYTVLSILFLFLVYRVIEEGPETLSIRVPLDMKKKEAATAV
jgi:hypothetical protein